MNSVAFSAENPVPRVVPMFWSGSATASCRALLALNLGSFPHRMRAFLSFFHCLKSSLFAEPYLDLASAPLAW